MRHQLLKLKKYRSTKSERKFSERLKALKIKFKTKVIINNREVDFVIKGYAIEINGHEQDYTKNIALVEAGYTPIHIPNNQVDIIDIYFLKE